MALTCCPKCKGASGYTYTMIAECSAAACGWDAEPEVGNIERRSVSLFECMDCGAKFRESTVKGEQQ